MAEGELVERFKAYVSGRMPEAGGLKIGLVNPIFGGASRQTYSLELLYERQGEPVSERVILRREFESGIIRTSVGTEFAAYQAFYGTEVPVPRVLWIEKDPKWLGTPFYVMEEILGCEDKHMLFTVPPFQEVREKVGERFHRIMATIARTDPAEVGLEGKLEPVAPETCWKRELDYWEAEADKNELEPHPVFRAAIRWLRRNPPPPAQKVVIVHGDMRAGNFLFNRKGEILGILDWEMMHMGDPLEDLAWSLNRLWSWSEPERAGFMIPRGQAVGIWEKASGFEADRGALFWWELFTSVKAIAIWVSMNRVYAHLENTDPIVGYGGIWATDLQRRIILSQMREIT
jgi:aminoglycoside phosphotransferase (APT) family kinase protein